MVDVLKNLNWPLLVNAVMSVIPALICITFHELSHGLVAYKLGDNTARSMGRLTLNPIKHIDVFGLLMMMLFKFGWAKPVPVDMRNFRNPKRGMALTALAGPVSNILLAVVVLFIYGAVYPFLYRRAVGDTILNMIYLTAYISVALAIFNIIPIPPLDGSKVLFSLASDQTYYKLMRYEKYGIIILLLIVAGGALGTPLADAAKFVFNKLFAVAEFSFGLMSRFT